MRSLMTYWQVVVVVLSLLNLVADVAARAHRPWASVATNVVCGVCWAVLLGQRGASLSRMVTIYGLLTYIFSAAAGFWLFSEDLSMTNRAGIVLGLVALALIGY